MRERETFSVKVGRSTIQPGKFIFFLSPREQLFMTVAMTEASLISVIVSVRDPSATKILLPTFTELGRDLYEQARYSGVHVLV